MAMRFCMAISLFMLRLFILYLMITSASSW